MCLCHYVWLQASFPQLCLCCETRLNLTVTPTTTNLFFGSWLSLERSAEEFLTLQFYLELSLELGCFHSWQCLVPSVTVALLNVDIELFSALHTYNISNCNLFSSVAMPPPGGIHSNISSHGQPEKI